jgi:hypothetical protein
MAAALRLQYPDEISHAGPVAIIRTAAHYRARLLCVLVVVCRAGASW